MKKILLTGFEPFDGMPVNPSYLAIQNVNLRSDSVQIDKLEVPTVFNESFKKVVDKIVSFQPDIILMFGLAKGRSKISIERIAININDARIADNRGNKPFNESIVINGPAAYFSTLPIYNLLSALSEKGVPTEISNSAGTYVCNHLMYQILHYISTHNLAIQAGFIHVPLIHEYNTDRKYASLELSEIIQSIMIMIEVLTKEIV